MARAAAGDGEKGSRSGLGSEESVSLTGQLQRAPLNLPPSGRTLSSEKPAAACASECKTKRDENERRRYPGKGEVSCQTPNHIAGQVRVLGVPDQADGDDLWAVHQDAADLYFLATVTLKKNTKGKFRNH